MTPHSAAAVEAPCYVIEVIIYREANFEIRYGISRYFRIHIVAGRWDKRDQVSKVFIP